MSQHSCHAKEQRNDSSAGQAGLIAHGIPQLWPARQALSKNDSILQYKKNQIFLESNKVKWLNSDKGML